MSKQTYPPRDKFLRDFNRSEARRSVRTIRLGTTLASAVSNDRSGPGAKLREKLRSEFRLPPTAQITATTGNYQPLSLAAGLFVSREWLFADPRFQSLLVELEMAIALKRK